MSLQESLNKFQKQQEKCHATLTSIAAKAGSRKSASTIHRATPHCMVPAVKFSSDTERLQQINSIRRAPAGAQIKRVIGLLYETRQALTSDEINVACYVDINSNRVVSDSLKNNTKVRYDGKHFAYKPTHDLKDKEELLDLIRKFEEGIAVVDLKDAYPTVMEDIQALKAVGLIWLLSNHDSQEDTAYTNDPKVLVKVEDAIKLFFRAIELPKEMTDIEKDLQKIGIPPATNTAERREKAKAHDFNKKPSQSKKKRRTELGKRTRVTNFHLPELLSCCSCGLKFECSSPVCI